MKQKLPFIILILLLSVQLFAQPLNTQTFSRVYPQLSKNGPKDLTNKTSQLAGIHTNAYHYDFSYNVNGDLVQEIYTDLYNSTNTFKMVYVYDENGDMIRAEIYSGSNWFYGSYEEFTYNSQHQRITRTNANNFGSGFVIGGIGYYEYDDDGNLTSYRQTLNSFGSYVDLSKTEYTYDEQGRWTGWNEYTWDNSWIPVYQSVMSYNTQYPNQYQDYVIMYKDGANWVNDMRYQWALDELGNVIERNYYLAASPTTWESSSEKYVFRHNTEVDAETVLFPQHLGLFEDWERWFQNPNPIQEADWWTINQNDNQLTYIETATYLYIPICLGIEDDLSLSAKLYPNPVVNHLNISIDAKGKAYLYDITGKLLKCQDVDNQSYIDMSSYSDGMYIVKIITDNKQVLTKKITKASL